MKNSKKILAIVLAIVMLFALSMTAFALYNAADIIGGDGVPPTASPDCPSYLVTTPTAANSATVTVVIEAADEYWEEEGAFYDEVEVTVVADNNNNGIFTLQEVMEQLDYDNSDYDITISGWNGLPFVQTIEHDGVAFTQESNINGSVLWGWTYRINDKLPVYAFIYEPDNIDGYRGTTIADTYVSDGDVIHFWWEYSCTEWGTNYAAEYVRLEPSVVGSTVTVTATSHRAPTESIDVGGGNYEMQYQIYKYEELAGVTVYLYPGVGTPLSAVTNASGIATFTSVPSGDYIVRSKSILLDDSNNDDEYTGFFFEQTSGYATVTVG